MAKAYADSTTNALANAYADASPMKDTISPAEFVLIGLAPAEFDAIGSQQLALVEPTAS